MTRKPPPGLFITGTDTDVGKTYVTAMIAAALVDRGYRVGVYKPAASGCRREEGRLVSDDALTLWKAAASPGELARVCPQMFAEPIAPHLAAAAEGKRLDTELLRTGLLYWQQRSEIVLVEGSGGLMSPLGEEEYVADLAYDFGYPMIVVAKNAIGVINQTLQTLVVGMTFRGGIDVAGVVLNEAEPVDGDPSVVTNFDELKARCVPPVLMSIAHGARRLPVAVDWFALASGDSES